MKRNLFLAACISMALNVNATAQDEDVIELEDVNVNGQSIPQFPYYPGAGGNGGNHDWEPSPDRDNEGNNTDPREEPVDPEKCRNLIENPPHGCTRSLSTKTASSQYSQFDHPYGIQTLFNYGNEQIFEQHVNLALGTLYRCYSDPFITSKTECEDIYIDSLDDACIHVGNVDSSGGTSHVIEGRRESCNTGVQDLRFSRFTASAARAGNNLLEDFQPSVGPGIVTVNVNNPLVRTALNSNRFNQLLLKAQKHLTCKVYADAWDKNKCGLYLPS